MRPRFLIALLSLCSLLPVSSLLAQSSGTARESRSQRSTRRRQENAQAGEGRVKTAATKKKREPAGAVDRTKPAVRKRADEKAASEPTRTKRTGARTAPASRVESRQPSKLETRKSTGTSSTSPKAPSTATRAAGSTETATRSKPTAKASTVTMAAADQAYFKKSYATALKQYQEAVRQRLVPQERRPLVDYRIARSLGFTEQWDASIAESLRVSSRYPNTIWDARSKSWLMRMYLKAPHIGWKLGDRIVRGKDVPETDSAAEPQRVDLSPEDRRKAVQYGEQSKLLYEKLREETKGTGEEADLTADLARLIASTQLSLWAEGRRWKLPSDDAWKLDPAAPYDPNWAPPKKVLQLYLSAEEVGTKAQKPLARLAQAMWLHGYHSLMHQEAWRQEPSGERKPIPYPYQDRSAPEVLRTLPRDFPEHPEGDHALMMVGDWLTEEGRFVDALDAYAALVKARPETKWAQAAKSAASAITRATLNVEPPRPQAPGKKATLSVEARNLPSVKFTAYPLKLEDVVKDSRVLSRPRAGISELLARIGKSAGLKKYYQGEPVTWEETLTPKSEYATVQRSIETPLTKNGAYAVEVESGPVRATVVLLISDLATMQIVDQDRATTMAVNAETGAPVVDAQVLIREVYTGTDAKQHVSAATSVTSAEGLTEKPLAPKRQQSDDVLSFAWKGDRYAFTGGTWKGRSEEAEAAIAYVYTDRPVYRPGQQVNFRALLAARSEAGVWKPLAGQKAKVQLLDAKGTPVDSRDVSANDFGTVHGKFTLGSQPPLGDYQIAISWGDKEHLAGGHGSFGVEEYKKPEFSVTVAPGESVARVGEPLKVRVSARYYFGAAVANARVKYRIHRSEWFVPSPFRHANDPAVPGSSEPWTPLPDAPEINGTAVTDANGDALLTIDTKVADPRFQGRHLTFAITAEVTDSSRRTIEGQGEVRALATQFNSFLETTRGFVSAGEPLTAEVRTVDAAGRPVAATGTGRVLRLFAESGKIRTEEVMVAPVHTDASGRGAITWSQSRPGRYEIRFEALDPWEQRVTASAEAWVAGDSAGEGVDASTHVRLVPELASYRAGQSARLLLIADQPNTTVLLTQEAGSRLLEKRVVRIDGRSAVVEIALTRLASPDVVVAVSGVRKREFFRTSATLAVPAAEQLLAVTVTPDKPVYKPGEKATFRLRARDAEGQAVRTEMSAGVLDASVLAISGDAGQPIAEALYGGSRGSDLNAQESFDPQFDPAVEDQQPPLKVVPADWSQPEGLGNIEPELFDRLPEGRLYGYGASGTRLARLGAPVARIPHITGAVNIGAKEAAPPPAIRRNFADTAFWAPSVVTDANGEATVSFNWPDNLTQWQMLVRGWSESGQVGESRAEVTTAKDLLVRLQAPRFFVERDELVLSANVHNYTPTAQKVKVSLQLEGQTLVPAGSAAPGPPSPRALNVPRADRPGGAITFGEESASADSLIQWIELPSGEEQRVDWRVRVDRPGEVKIRVLAEAEADSDAVELTFPVLAHGVEKRVQKSGAILMGAGEKPGTRSEKVTVTVPAERAPDAGELVVQVSPSAGMVMLDALPYLADYPYGCTEQTMSRFMPTVVSAKVLRDLGLDLDDLRKRLPKGEGPASRGRNPVFLPATLKSMTTDGLERLRRFQHPNGGWGWWEDDTSDDRITAYVLQGLLAGKEAGVAVPASMLERGMAYLEGRFAKETDPHDRTYEGWVLSLDRKRAPAAANSLLESAYPKRDRLTAYGLALLALTLKNGGHPAEARICMENLENTARIDKENGTCSWTRNLGTWWEWYNQDVETTAACLRVFNALEPKHRLAPMIVRWLANNRTGASWSSTRDTALAVYALAEYVKGQRELAPDYTLTVDVGGRQKKSFRVNAENALTFDNRLVIPAAALGSGTQEITVTREGEGNVYFTAAVRYFTLEEGVKAAGNEIRVRRRYYRLTRPGPDGKEELTKDGYRRTVVNAGDRLNSGDLLEVELLVESKNAYEHLVFEDMKPSGCEPVELRSGTRYGNGLCSNLELRDDRVAFFVTNLPQGKRLLSYRMRAETPGAFHALPLTGYAMYAPAIRCISDEGNFSVEDNSSVRGDGR